MVRILSAWLHWLSRRIPQWVPNYGHTEHIRFLDFVHFSVIFLLETFFLLVLSLLWLSKKKKKRPICTRSPHLKHWCFGPLTLYESFIKQFASLFYSILSCTLLRWTLLEWSIGVRKSLYHSLHSLAVTTQLLSLYILHQKECHHHKSKKPKPGSHLRYFSFLFHLFHLSHLFLHMYFCNIFQHSFLTYISFSHRLL